MCRLFVSCAYLIYYVQSDWIVNTGVYWMLLLCWCSHVALCRTMLSHVVEPCCTVPCHVKPCSRAVSRCAGLNRAMLSSVELCLSSCIKLCQAMLSHAKLCCWAVLLSRVVVPCCQAMLSSRVVKLCCWAMLWSWAVLSSQAMLAMLSSHLVKPCCQAMLSSRVVKPCCRAMLSSSVVEPCCPAMLSSHFGRKMYCWSAVRSVRKVIKDWQ